MEDKVKEKVEEIINSDYADAVASFKITWGEGQQKKVVIEVTFKPHIRDEKRKKELMSSLNARITPKVSAVIRSANEDVLIVVK